MTWADKEFPSKEKKDLDLNQKNIVKKRNENLETYLGNLDKNLEVKKISTSERVGAITWFTSTKEAEVQESLNTQDTTGKTGESIIIFLLKKD